MSTERPNLIIIRGLPGSGKTTRAREFGYLIVEGDMFRFQPDGSYLYSKETNKPVADMCYAVVDITLNSGYSVIVSNTSYSQKHIEPYISLGQKHCAKIKIIEMKNNFKSIHNVPEPEMKWLESKWEPLKGEWKEYLV